MNIESPFTFGDSDGPRLLEGDPPSRLAPVLDLLGERVRAATVWLDSRLELRFENGARIEVPSGPKYESWQVSGPDGLLIVSTPGGGEPALWPGGEDQVDVRPT